jgi:cysteine-rich repeat protein
VLVSIAIGGCLSDRAYRCTSDDECLARADGLCTAEEWCAYPDEGCASGFAYGPFSPASLANACVEPGDGSGGESGEEPEPLCGNGMLDPGEVCDDGNRIAGDSCHPQCVDPGTPAWTATYDGEVHDEDRGFGVAVDPGADAIYVTGLTVVDGTDWDILVQRWRLETGTLVWTRAFDGGALGVDTGEHVAVDSRGNIVVAGVITTDTRGTDAWLAKFTADGEELWTVTHDEAGGDDKAGGVAILDGDVIVTTGHVEADGRTDAWIQRWDPDGGPLGDAVRVGESGFNDGIDIIARGDEYQVTGQLNDATDGPAVWTAVFAANGTLRWEHVLTMGDNGNAPRGVGQDFDPLGGSAIAGVIGNDILVQRYDDVGMPTTSIVLDGPAGVHDEAADVAFSADGSFVVVGLLDFRTEGFATSDAWIARYTADQQELWSDRFEGAAKEIDKALGLVVLDDLSAVVVGYETVPGQSRDVWLRRYAL